MDTPEMELAWQLITNTNTSVFLTGKAGTGKTTFLRRLRENTPKRLVVLAPTGVAAINAQGQTIHSFFQLPLGPIVPGASGAQSKKYSMSQQKKRLIRSLDLIIIDEISMVRCDLLDAIDTELRKYKDRSRPFGGVQMLLIGDLQQLAPVAREAEWQLLAPFYATPYFFGSKALAALQYTTIELTHIFRQQDDSFISILGKIRDGAADVQTLQALNSRYIPSFIPPAGEDWIRLTTHNRMADSYNSDMLRALPGKGQTFTAKIKGTFPETSYPADKELLLKPGAQVMFIKNDPSADHAYYNGKIGVVTEITDDGDIVVYSKETKNNIKVTPVDWENTKYTLDPQTKEITEEVEGVFRQYPLRLAWAITVHKSQGLTFDHAVLDIQFSFTHGQTYVALSRCRTLEGLVMARPIDARAVITDGSVNSYIESRLRQAEAVKEQLPQLIQSYHLSLLDEAFSFRVILSDLQYLTRVVDEHLYKQFPLFLHLLKDSLEKVKEELCAVSSRFAAQYSRMALAGDPQLQERIYAAVKYFNGKTVEIIAPIMKRGKIEIANKQTKKQYNNALEALRQSYKEKTAIYEALQKKEFTVKNYLDAKAKAELG